MSYAEWLGQQRLLRGKLIGASGAQGPLGPIGFGTIRGPSGPTGPQGIEGPSGSRGMKGNSGPTGPTGPTGPRGATGLEFGDMGATGASGPSGHSKIGNTGPTGPVGVVGVSGPSGLPGIQHVDGIQGDIGPPGISSLASYNILANGKVTLGRESKRVYRFENILDGNSNVQGIYRFIANRPATTEISTIEDRRFIMYDFIIPPLYKIGENGALRIRVGLGPTNQRGDTTTVNSDSDNFDIVREPDGNDYHLEVGLTNLNGNNDTYDWWIVEIQRGFGITQPLMF